MRSTTKAGEPQKLELQLCATEKSQLETIDVISDDQFLSMMDDYYDKVEALEKKADKPIFPMADRSKELNAVRNEVSKLARTGCDYLRLAYLKYLSALGFSVEDANFLTDNLEGPCRSSIYEKVQRAKGALDMKTMLIL
jgi:hypothetical protein